MTTLASGLDTDIRATLVAANSRVYVFNDFDKPQVWDGIGTTTNDAGIDAPAGDLGTVSALGTATAVSAGDHQARYRYKDSQSGYISNPSGLLEFTVTAGTTALTWGIATAGAEIDISDDAKVDTILLEMTPVGVPDFYVAAEVLDTQTSVTVSLVDSQLTQQIRVDSLYGNDGHAPPPLAKLAVEHKGRLFVGGSSARTRTGATVTISSTTVVAASDGDFSEGWAGRALRTGTSATPYTIDTVTVTASPDELTLTKTYTAATSTSASITVWSKTQNKIFWSKSFYPESFDTTSRGREVLQGKSDGMSGLFSYGADLYIAGQHSMERLVYDVDPALGAIDQIKTEHGLWNQFCWVEASGRVYGWGRSGAWVMDGLRPVHFSKPIDEAIDDEIDKDEFAKFHGCYDPIERKIRWWYVVDGDTHPKKAISFEIDTGQWGFDTWQQGITSSRIIPDSEGRLACMVGDENGHTWFLGIGEFDGVPSTSASVLTVTSVSTSNLVFTVDEALPTTEATLAGVTVYHHRKDEQRIISSNTANTFTITAVFSSTPVSGDTLYLGRIDFQLLTKHWVADGQQTKKRPSYFFIKFVPGSGDPDNELRVFVFEDGSSTPQVTTQGSEDTPPNNVTLSTDGTYWIVDMAAAEGDGFVSVPLSSNWKRAVQVKLQSVIPAGSINILDAYFADRQGQSLEVGE